MNRGVRVHRFRNPTPNTTSATVTVTSVSASSSIGDVPLKVTYTLSNQPGTASGSLTVERPTSLQVNSDTTNGTGHTCIAGAGTSSCASSYYSGSGTYSSYLRTRTYHIMDQFSPARWIQGYNMQIQESYTTPTGQCSADGSVITSGGVGDTVTDCFYFCSATCRSGGSCSVSATQTLTVNGFNVATENVGWTCTGATVSP